MQVRRKGVVKRIIRVCPVLNLAVPTRYIEQAVMVILNAETGVLAGVGPAPCSALSGGMSSKMNVMRASLPDSPREYRDSFTHTVGLAH